MWVAGRVAHPVIFVLMDSSQPFSPEYRDTVASTVLKWASEDNRVVAGAIVGSMATGPGDRWSDLDLSFGIDNSVSVAGVLEDFTGQLNIEFSAAKLFDLPVGQSIYRVFLLPGCLQLDLSFSPADHFGAIGSHFKLLFGATVERPQIPLPRAENLFGYAVHHLLRARICIERGRLLQAEYWVSSARDYTLHLACLHCGLSTFHGRGFDQLPFNIRDQIPRTLVHAFDRDSLLSALCSTITLLLDQSSLLLGMEVLHIVEPQLRMLASSWKT